MSKQHPRLRPTVFYRTENGSRIANRSSRELNKSMGVSMVDRINFGPNSIS